MSETKGFCMFYDWIEDLDYCDPADAWEIVKAIGSYFTTGENPTEKVTENCRGMVSMMMHQIKRSEVKSAAGKKGAAVTNGRSKKVTENKNDTSAATLPSADCRHANATKTETETETNTETKTKTETKTETLTETKNSYRNARSFRARSPCSPPRGRERVRSERRRYLFFKNDGRYVRVYRRHSRRAVL